MAGLCRKSLLRCYSGNRTDMTKMKGNIVYCASDDGNVAAEYTVHQTEGWRVPLCKLSADVMRKLQKVFDNEVQN